MKKFGLLISLILLFGAGCTPIEEYPLEMKVEMEGELRPAYYFDINSEGLLTVEAWWSQEQKDVIGPKQKQLDQETIVQLKKLIKKASRKRGKKHEIVACGAADILIVANGEEYPYFIYGWARNESLDQILGVLIEQSPIPLVDFAGNPIKPFEKPPDFDEIQTE